LIYIIKNTKTNNIKIGISKNPAKRVLALQTGNESLLVLEHIVENDTIWKDKQVESMIHHKLGANRKKGEWFQCSSELLAWLKGIDKASYFY